MSFKDEFEKIVMDIAKEAKLQATCFADRIEALKALNVSYGLMMKHAKEEDESEGGFTFSGGNPAEEQPSGTPKVRTRPRGN